MHDFGVVNYIPAFRVTGGRMNKEATGSIGVALIGAILLSLCLAMVIH